MYEKTIVGTAIEHIRPGSAVEAITDTKTGATLLQEYRAPVEGIPEHVVLSREVAEAGLVVGYIIKGNRKGYYSVQIWAPDGTLWAEGSGEGADTIRWHIQNWKNRD